MKRRVDTHSQHFLHKRTLIAELIGHSSIRARDTVIDIGAGSGAITSVLACRCASVIAYENEPNALKILQQNMTNVKNVTIVPRDFLRATLPNEPYKVFANIPFILSSKIILRLVHAPHPPEAIYLIVQKQFAQKLVLSTPHFHSALGQALAPWWKARIRRPLRRTDFSPPPAVDAVLLELKPRSDPLLDARTASDFYNFILSCYHDPRFFARYYRVGSKPSQLKTEQWLTLYAQSKSKK